MFVSPILHQHTVLSCFHYFSSISPVALPLLPFFSFFSQLSLFLSPLCCLIFFNLHLRSIKTFFFFYCRAKTWLYVRQLFHISYKRKHLDFGQNIRIITQKSPQKYTYIFCMPLSKEFFNLEFVIIFLKIFKHVK